MKKQLHILQPHHHAHLSAIGVPWLRPPHLRCTEEEYSEAYDAWKRSHPHAEHQWLHTKTLGNIAWQQHQEQEQAAAQQPVRHVDHRRELRLVAAILLGLLLLLLAPHAHCQFSHINTITTCTGGNCTGPNQVGFHASSFGIICSTNTACTDDGTNFTITASATAATAWSGITAATNSNAGTFAMSGNTLDLTLATIVKLRVAGGLTTSANGDCGYDSTAKVWHCWQNGADRLMIASTNLGSSGQACASGADGSCTFGTLANAALANSSVTINTAGPLGGGGAVALGNALSLTCTGCLTSVTAHNLLSATHGDTTAASAVRGDGLFAIGAGATWQRLAHSSATGGYFKWNGSDIVASSLAASGTGTPTACSNQFVTSLTLNADAAPSSSCTTATLASAQFANQGTTTTVLHGNAAGNPSFAAVTSADTTGTFTATAHNLLSSIHGDTSAASVSRGDIITGQGASPTWSRLGKGTQYQSLQGGASEPLYDALHLDQATAVTGILPAGNLPAAVVYNNQANTYSGAGLQDFSAMKFKPPTSVVGSLPSAAASTSLVYEVTDGASASDCTVGSGSTRVWCVSTGSAWTAIGDGGSGGSGASTGDAFITVGHPGDLTAERNLAGTANHITATDGGANGDITLDVGSQVVLNNQANTYTGGGLQDLGSDSLRTTGREGIGGAELSTNRLALYADHNTERVFRITDTNAGPYDTWELDNGYNINSNGLGWYNVTNAEIPFWINHSNSILMGMGTRDGIGDIGLVTQNRPNNVYAKAKVETKLLADPSTAGYKGSLSSAMVGDGRLLYDAACSSSSSPTNATSATGAFTAADVGKVFAIAHGGTGGKLLSTTISSVTNSTTIVMATSCVTTTSADWAVVGTDNSAAMKAQTDAMHDLTPSGLDPGGGLLKVGAGIYVMKTTWTPKTSQGWITIQGTGPSSTLFVFVPVCTCSTANNNDRPFSVDFTSISTRRQIANAIAKGATTFTLSAAGDGSDLVAGEWLVIAEYDTLAGGGEPIAIDWVQVVSVVTTTVTVKHPFRTAFSVGRTYSNAAPLGGLGFVRATNDVFQNVAFKDFGIIQPDSGTAMPSIAIGYSIGSTVDNVWVDNPNGQNFYCYRGKDVTFTRNRSGSSKISNEVAACVDVMMDNNVFGGFGSAVSNYQVASSSAFTVDDGTAFFSFTNNKLPESADIAIQATRGVHDGVIKDNQVGWVRNGGTGQGQAIVCQGCLNLTIEGNTFAGGDGTNTGVSLANTTTLNVQINSSGNIVGVNKFGTFTTVYGTMLAADSYFTLIGTEYQIVPQPGTSGGVKLYDSGGVNAITDQTSGTITSYTVNRPLAATSGALINVNSSNTITQSFSGDSAHSLSQLAKTAAVTTFTLCAATAGTACGQAGQYRISYNFYGSGTACSSVTAGSVGLNLTWTDTNAVTHTTISMPLWDQKAAAMTNGLFNFNTALTTESASGSYIISTNGTIIQAATTYTACTTGTGTYNLKMTVEQLQ